MSQRRRVVATLAGLAMVPVLLAACQKKLEAAQFVGQWKSSRLTLTPLHLLPNGEWEIRTSEGKVLQYGLWQLDGQRLVWTVRDDNGDLTRDVNPVVSVEARRFVLRERDGSQTTFDRLD
jgi:hypothetical protein